MIKNGLALGLGIASAALGSNACRDRDLSEQGLLQGVVEFEQRFLSFEVAGRVQKVAVERGDSLDKGALVARIDDALERLQQARRESEVSGAQAQLELVRAGARPEEIRSLAAQVRAAKAVETQLQNNFERERALHARGVTPRAVVDDLEAQVSRARAERQALEHRLAMARKGARSQEVDTAAAQVEALSIGTDLEKELIERHRLHTEHAGVVLDVHVKPGEFVAPGTPVITLGDTSHPYVDVFVPAPELPKLKVGSKAHLLVDAVDERFEGRVEHIAERAEFTPRYLFSERERPNLVFRVRVRVQARPALHTGLPTFVSIDGVSP